MRGVVSGLAALAGLALAVSWSVRDARASIDRSHDLADADHVQSRRCRSCHRRQYDSWHRTYHRTMTRQAGPETVIGDFADAEFEYLGVHVRMSHEPRDGFVMHFSRGAERWRAIVERTVGSHRYQQYLARDGDIYYRLPVAWNVDEERWMHMNGAFLTPDPTPAQDGLVDREDFERHVTRWNDNCVFCHNVRPNPGFDEHSGRFDTRVEELGIACEACHGPGSTHVRLNGNPVRRYALHLTELADGSIVNPDRLQTARTSEICGRCHGQRITGNIGRFMRDGDPFIPGEPLSKYSRPLARDTTLGGEAGVFAARFWRDGTPRLTAYEYQGMLASPCVKDDNFGCESCHAMHESDPAGQLRADALGDAACTGCHAQLADVRAAARHSHHPVDSSGTACRACHMPQLVYGLVGARISHRIEVPDPGRQQTDSRPDACTLCHVDRPRTWAIAETARLWPSTIRAQPLPRVGTRHPDADPAATDAGPRAMSSRDGLAEMAWLVRAGDPIERAVAVHALGNPDVPNADPGGQLGLLLECMIADDYPAVRAIAWRSVRRLAANRAGRRLLAADFTPTQDAGDRRKRVSSIAEALGDVRWPDAHESRALRGLAARVAISIGE